MKTIALANQKGGVGKTTTAASLGIGLSRQGKKVLLIDADAQGNLTQMLGWPQPDELSPTLSTLMEKIIAEQPIAPGEGILHHQSGVHLVPANIELSALEVTLVNTMSRETVLRQYLSTVADRYDYALIDCMPSLGIRLYPETRRQMDGWLEESNSKNRNEFVEKALRFYMGYLGTENITEFLSDALVATLRGIIADSTNRTNGILFKCAVEQGIMAHTIAAHFRDTLEDRRALRGYVVDEVKRTNGQIRFEDAQDVQRQLPDDTWRD